jgi:hypothetical protein
VSELEFLDPERRVRQAKFPVAKSMDSFDFFDISGCRATER